MTKKQSKQKAFVVYKGIDEDVKNRHIEVVPFDEKLEYLQGLVGGLIEHFIIDRDLDRLHIDMWIDDEGKLKEGLKPTFALLHDGKLYDYILGNCVFSKYTDQGETLGLSPDEVGIVTRWLHDQQVVGLVKRDGSSVPVLAVDL